MDLSEFSKKRVLVVGDICLDRNRVGDVVYGSCREADIATMRFSKGKKGHKDEYSPGAGGNVAVNFASLGAKVSIAGIIGDDFHGNILSKELISRGVNLDFLYGSATRATITFERTYNACDLSKPVSRWDTENKSKVPKAILGKLRREVKKNAEKFDAIVVTDYCEVDSSTALITESFLEDIISLRSKVKIFGSSRNRIGEFEGFYCLVPNDNELIRANNYEVESFGEDILMDRVIKESKIFYQRTRPEYLVVTAGSRGAFLYDNKVMQVIPTRPLDKSTIDVMGCGDTFLAALTLADISGYSREDAIRLANAAAGTTAKKLGTTGAPTQKELSDALESYK